MALEFKDWFHQYSPRGDARGLFNVARDDMTNLNKRYNAYFNEAGAYIIQQTTTSGTATNRVYKYYAKAKPADFDADWTGRTGLTYVEFYELFRQD